MSASESTAVVQTCAFCGQPCTDVAKGRGWIHLEVTRENGADDLHWWDVDFCSQAHAVEWLARPLPAPLPHVGQPVRTMGNRLADAGCFAVLALVVVLLAVGSWTVTRFVGGLF